MQFGLWCGKTGGDAFWARGICALGCGCYAEGELMPWGVGVIQRESWWDVKGCFSSRTCTLAWPTFADLPVGYKAENSKWPGSVSFVPINWLWSGTVAVGSVLSSPQVLVSRLSDKLRGNTLWCFWRLWLLFRHCLPGWRNIRPLVREPFRSLNFLEGPFILEALIWAGFCLYPCPTLSLRKLGFG